MIEFDRRQNPNRIIPVGAIAGVELRVGDKIGEVVTLRDLDSLVDLLAVKVSGKSFSGVKLIDDDRALNVFNLSEYFRDDEEKYNFHGTIRNFDVTIEELEYSKDLSFRTIGIVYSTGRGAVTRIERVNSLYVKKNGNPTLKTKLLREGELQRDIRKVITNSKLAAVGANYLQGLESLVADY